MLSLETVLGESDRARILDSTYCPLYKHILPKDRIFFRESNKSLSKSRVFLQLILSNTRYQTLYFNGVSHGFSPLTECLLCCKDFDTFEHFFYCPARAYQILEDFLGWGFLPQAQIPSKWQVWFAYRMRRRCRLSGSSW